MRDDLNSNTNQQKSKPCFVLISINWAQVFVRATDEKLDHVVICELKMMTSVKLDFELQKVHLTAATGLVCEPSLTFCLNFCSLALSPSLNHKLHHRGLREIRG